MRNIPLWKDEALSVNDVSPTVTPTLEVQREGLFQFAIDTGTGTVVLQGRINPDLPWEDIQSLSGDDAVTVALFPLMQVKCTASSSLVATAALLA